MSRTLLVKLLLSAALLVSAFTGGFVGPAFLPTAAVDIEAPLHPVPAVPHGYGHTQFAESPAMDSDPAPSWCSDC